VSLITFFDLRMFVSDNHHGMVRLNWWGLIDYIVCSSYTLHTNELLGSLAIALPGWGINIIYVHDHALLLLLALLLCMVGSFC
jgi:hypothetical protein